MTKQEQFLWIAQTAFLANAVNITALDADARDRRAEFSASGSMIFMDEAIRASSLIPEKLSAYEAAEDFIGWALPNLREPGGRLPLWFAR